MNSTRLVRSALQLSKRTELPARTILPCTCRSAPSLRVERRAFSSSVPTRSTADQFVNIISADAARPMVSIASLTPTAGFTLSDGLVVPSPIIIIDGTVFLWDVGVPNDQDMTWEGWSQDKLKIFETVTPRPEILLVGTGKRGLFPPPAFKKHLNSLGIQVDVLDSRNASSTYNLLAEEGRRVAAALDDLFGSNAPDSTSDFLARERAALGDEFTSGSNTESFDHDFEASASAFPDLDANGDDGLSGFVAAPAISSVAKGPYEGGMGALGGGQQQAPHVSVTGHDDLAQFESEYPEVEVAPAPAPAAQNGFTSAPSYNQPTSMFSGTPQPKEEESEFIKSWRSKQAEDIAKREEASAKKREETIVKAQNAIDNFYKDYNQKKEQNIAKNKEEEAAFDAKRTEDLAKGTTWERICTLVDLQDSRSKTTTKSKQDMTRFKEILLGLKREGEHAPGAGGY